MAGLYKYSTYGSRYHLFAQCISSLGSSHNCAFSVYITDCLSLSHETVLLKVKIWRHMYVSRWGLRNADLPLPFHDTEFRICIYRQTFKQFIYRIWYTRKEKTYRRKRHTKFHVGKISQHPILEGLSELAFLFIFFCGVLKKNFW
jgi:hypothetical protein